MGTTLAERDLDAKSRRHPERRASRSSSARLATAGVAPSAARGAAALALETGPGGDAESPFEESVITVIRSWGYNVVPQVGTAGYRIDIGIRHPEHSGAYALGVECDGYMYHSSRAARDRDRLREHVLRDLGWRLHRIWGTAWYRYRHGEEVRLRAAIEEAVAAPITGLLGSETPEPTRPVIETERETFDVTPRWTEPYRTATVAAMPSWINDAVRAADFLNMTGDIPFRVRTPTQACKRDVEQIHPVELAQALLSLTDDAAGISRDELTTRVSRLFGWTRRGQDIRLRMDSMVDQLVSYGSLTEQSGSLTVIKRQ